MDDKSEELPVGFGMSLAMNKQAMDYYSKLSYTNQQKIVNYIQNSNTGFEAKDRINSAVSNLSLGDISFLQK